MKVKIKKLDAKAVIPSYAHVTDAGMDLTATSMKWDEEGNFVYGTGLAFEIPEGYVGLLFPRSSIAKKTLVLSNAVGVLDSGYRGEVLFKFKPTTQTNVANPSSTVYDIGDRIGQLIILPYPKIEFEEVVELSDSDRGMGGYGSTNK